MRITDLHVENFRAVGRATLDDLQGMVVVAGPNGCGKSSLLDAIRLLKSSYGGYRKDEWQQWFGEFKIDITGRGRGLNPIALLQDRSLPMRIALRLELTPSEIDYLREHARQLIQSTLWEERAPGPAGPGFAARSPIAREIREHKEEIAIRTEKEWALLEPALNLGFAEAELIITPEMQIETKPSPLLELAFSTYAPKDLGIIDYHGAHRSYGREKIGGINLSLEESNDRMSQHLLYNYNNKYSNIKSEIASSYIRAFLMKEAGDIASSDDSNLVQTLSELFETFFPGKRFTGPRPTKEGTFEFLVELDSGATHDIDELSSGEKEILYGYLRLRNSAPRNSILLLDEPELHLNPRLVRGLSLFYERHLGKALNNQIWVVTHSDALLREAVEQPNFRVFHMRSAVSGNGENQVNRLSPKEDVEKAVIDLVGDLSVYRPGAKVVIFEGGGESEFDVWMTGRLFPKFAARVNPISGGNKQRVSGLFVALSAAAERAKLGARFYCIVDRDADRTEEFIPGGRSYRWDVYHIENYLLSGPHILRALMDLNPEGDWPRTVEEVEVSLRDIARETLDGLVKTALQREVGDALLRCIQTGIDPSKPLVDSLQKAAARSAERATAAVNNELSTENLSSLEKAMREKFESALVGTLWQAEFRGRDILRIFSGKFLRGTKYEHFRNLIIAKMAEDDYQPSGMAEVINQIETD